MKGKFWRKTLAAALALLVVSGNVPIRSVANLFSGAAITASALESEPSGQCGENATWVYDRAIGKLTISGTGAMYDYECDDATDTVNSPWFAYKDDITSVEIENGITSIGIWAFDSCANLTSIKIPDSVTSIGESAFADCDGLESVEIGSGVTSIGNHAFYNCTGLTSIEISDSVISIGDGAFENCTGLTSITIPDSVTSIGAEAFYDCAGLTSITIPDSVTSISDAAFLNCTSLESAVIGNSVEGIGNYAFYNCKGLTSITIPDSVTSIEAWAFCYCESLTEVTIPDSVTSIGESAFYYCISLTDVYCYANPENLTWDDGDCDDFIYDSENAPDVHYTTVCHVPAKYYLEYDKKFGAESKKPVNVRFVGDLVDMGLGEHLYGHSITLDGSIGVNFYVELTDELLASETAEMVFIVPNGSKTDTQTLLVTDVIANDKNKVSIGSKTYYKFKCSVSAKDMASTITAQLVDGEKSGTKYTYSVKEYADYLLAHTDVEEYAYAAPLVKSMLNYGAASQTYFGIEGTAANAELDDADKAFGEVSDLDTFELDNNVALPEGVTFEGATLSLKSETTLSLYFTGLPEGTVFTCGDKTVESVKNGKYVIARIRGIKASELENNFTVTFDEDGRVTYNAMTYCYNVLNDGTNDTALQNVCKALYQYAQAAKTYSK